MRVTEEGGVKHFLKSLVCVRFVKYRPIVIRTSPYRSDAEEVSLGREREFLFELRKKK